MHVCVFCYLNVVNYWTVYVWHFNWHCGTNENWNTEWNEKRLEWTGKGNIVLNTLKATHKERGTISVYTDVNDFLFASIPDLIPVSVDLTDCNENSVLEFNPNKKQTNNSIHIQNIIIFILLQLSLCIP